MVLMLIVPQHHPICKLFLTVDYTSLLSVEVIVGINGFVALTAKVKMYLLISMLEIFLMRMEV